MAFKIQSKLDDKVQLSSRSSSIGRKRSLSFGGSVYEPQEEDDRKTIRWATAAAVLFHVVLLVVTFPTLRAEPREIRSSRKVYVVEEVRFQPPPPKQQQQVQPKKQTHRIPIPDPTPDDPEPIIHEIEVEAPEIDDTLGDFVHIPSAPSSGTGPMWLDGNIDPPEKIYAPQPRYTEEARKARIQGVVILQAIIDAVGNVTKVKVLKGLPEGLAESAVATVSEWRFRPATLQGKPVPVYLNLTVSFSLQ